MTGAQPASDELFVGLENAERRLSTATAERLSRIRTVTVFGLIVGAQLAWLAAFAYAAYLFIL